MGWAERIATLVSNLLWVAYKRPLLAEAWVWGSSVKGLAKITYI